MKYTYKDAIFSSDRIFRYALLRMWDKTKPGIIFIGVNPSTANETEDDPTIRRVIRFAKDWGYGEVMMMNLYALISSDPSILASHVNPVGMNDFYLEYMGKTGADVLFAYGSFKEAKDRAKLVGEIFKNPLCLGTNKDGSPKHPLYIKASTKPIPYQSPELLTTKKND